MRISQNIILSGAIWTIGVYLISMSLRLGSNIVLSRLLAPNLIGVIIVVNTIKVGVELFSDLGIEQNVVKHKDGDGADFLNTAWTLQVLRGIFLTGVFLAISPLLSDLYHVDLSVFLVVAFSPFINSLASTAVFILVRDLKVRQRSAFELSNEAISFVITILLAWMWQSVWAIVGGTLISIAIRSALSHLLPHPPHRFSLVKEQAWDVINLGKWIMLSSLLMYSSGQVDKIYLGKVVPFAVFGIYGLARTISDLPNVLAGRLSYQILFPLISASKHLGNAAIVKTMAPQRLKLIFVACLGISFGIAWADYAVRIVYDPRYYQAGWMLCVLLCGAWFSVLSGLNEVVLLSEKPIYHSISHCVRLATMIVGLSTVTAAYGILGAVAAVSVSEVCRYLALAYGQERVKFSFVRQDGAMTLLLIVLVLFWSGTRYYLGLGQAWQGMFLR